ncbi:YfiT family bacillithiol transferase [Flavobacterium cerinum]|uniref:Metal-dependent hydrolase n=1 Tax=Flavobacterium cerinum TaxID=2502784 RepID=A0ABY5ITH5_9FLAO|nr:putative metal-dependent hydrolase [Flavobacterium cerinum]UUC46141.1 putative metal-dependent hydrolase [Flavobacterium cerinum]
MELEQLKYPIGKFIVPTEIDNNHIREWKTTLKKLPQDLEKQLQNLTTKELNWIYRPEGWSIKQVVHHLADSHTNSFIRFKLTLTENVPAIRPYEEQLWAATPDGKNDDISASLQIINGIHNRWSYLLDNLSEADMNLLYFHPQHQRLYSLKEAIGIYDWHSRHHLAHIQQALNHKGLF